MPHPKNPGKGGPEEYAQGLGGRKIRSKGRGRGLGRGRGRGPLNPEGPPTGGRGRGFGSKVIDEQTS